MIRKFSFSTRQLQELPYAMEGVQNSLLRTRDLEIINASTIHQPHNSTLIFCTRWSGPVEERLATVQGSLLLLPVEAEVQNQGILERNVVLRVENPRLEYALLLTHILRLNHRDRQYRRTEDGAVLGEDVLIGQGTRIEPFAFLDHDVVIGDSCLIKSGSRICSHVRIGNHTVIRENSVVGGQGFGVERRRDRTTVKIPHIGGVQIGSQVEIGALNTVVSGTIEPTVIEDYVKADDHVHIGHNCRICKGALLTACVETGARNVIGENSWLGPNSTLIENITLGKNCFVGIGSVVTKSFGDDLTVAGNPAMPLDELKAFQKVKKRLLEDFRD